MRNGAITEGRLTGYRYSGVCLPPITQNFTPTNWDNNNLNLCNWTLTNHKYTTCSTSTHTYKYWLALAKSLASNRPQIKQPHHHNALNCSHYSPRRSGQRVPHGELLTHLSTIIHLQPIVHMSLNISAHPIPTIPTHIHIHTYIYTYTCT